MNRYAIYRAAGIFLCIVYGSIAGQNLAALELQIRYYDQQLYTIDSRVYIRLSINNTSPESKSFRLAEHRQFSVDFDIRTDENIALNPSRRYLDIQTGNRPIFYREIHLEPGEEFAFVEELNHYSEINNAGMYTIQAHFNPGIGSAADGRNNRISSNRLNLSIRPAMSQIETALMEAEEEIRIALLKQDLPPDQTVRYVIESRQREQWERFFLYLDVERIMLRNPNLARQFRNSNPNERREMVETYRKLMQQQETDDEILQIPQSFTIMQTEYTPTDGSVTVRSFFRYPGYTEVREYIYYLQRENGYWQIYDYAVRNLGTSE
ncbi:hypothetical protein [Spirochaeta dissipatitropha]